MTDDEPNIAPENAAAMLSLSLAGALKSGPAAVARRFAGTHSRLFGGPVRLSTPWHGDLSNGEYRLSLAGRRIAI
jgi:hypothetical protein